MVRCDLQLSAGLLPESALRAAWRALDSDNSGYISRGVFGQFMRKGEPHPDGNSVRLWLSACLPPRFGAFHCQPLN